MSYLWGFSWTQMNSFFSSKATFIKLHLFQKHTWHTDTYPKHSPRMCPLHSYNTTHTFHTPRTLRTHTHKHRNVYPYVSTPLHIQYPHKYWCIHTWNPHHIRRFSPFQSKGPDINIPVSTFRRKPDQWPVNIEPRTSFFSSICTHPRNFDTVYNLSTSLTPSNRIHSCPTHPLPCYPSRLWQRILPPGTFSYGPGLPPSRVLYLNPSQISFRKIKIICNDKNLPLPEGPHYTWGRIHQWVFPRKYRN